MSGPGRPDGSGAHDPVAPGPGAGALPPPPRRVRSLTAATATVVALAAWAGALAAQPMTLLLPAVLAVVAAALRRPVLLALPVALAASAMGSRALDGLAAPAPGPADGTATLVTDPEVRWGRTEVVARLDGRHVLLRAEGPAGEILAARLAGERVEVDGHRRPLPARAAWLRVRHVAAEVRVRSARAGPDAAPPWRAANHLRRLLDRGAEPLGEEGRALYLGLVLGDDRGQSPETVDDFRGSGLAHLLAVSGQNVAFVLGLVAPGLARLRIGPRLVVAAAVLALFALATRCEPSVLRAVAMAGGALLAAARGRPTSGVQVLALAVAGLVLVDPLLVRSLGFQMSVAATAGILLLGPPLARVVRGPRPLVVAATVSAAAQLAVAPLQVATFGGVPVASLPANLLAGPAAAVVMTWGLPAGLLAGLLGSPWDGWLHRPTGAALSALAAVGRVGASVPLGELGPWHVAVVAVALAVLVAGRHLPVRPAAASAAGSRPSDGSAAGERRTGGPPARRILGALATVVLLGALAAPAAVLRRPPPVARPAAGLTVWRAGGATVVVIGPGTGPVATLEGLRRAGVVDIDLLVVGPGAAAGDEERAAGHRARVGRTWQLGRDLAGPKPSARVGSLEVRRVGAAVCVRRTSDPPCPAHDGDGQGGR